jgi:hypothetical protein
MCDLRRLCAWALAVLLVGSADALAQATRFPVFEGTVVPISQPIQVRYGSFEAEETTHVQFEAGPERGDMVLKLHRRVQRRGDELHQVMQIRDIAVTGARIPRKDRKQLASLRFVMRSDVLGVAKSFDVEGLEHLGVPPSEAEVVRTEFRSMAKPLTLLPAHPVKSGDAFLLLPLRESLTGDDHEMAWMFPASPVSFVLAGHGYFDGTKVFVATVLTDLSMDIPEDDGSGSITVGGYTLYEATTMAHIKTEVLMIMNLSSTGGERITMNMRAHGRSTFKPLGDAAALPALIASPSLVGLSVQSKLDAEGKPQTYAFFDVRWRMTNPRAEAVEGKLVVLDDQGKERIAMPWSIAATDAAQAAFTETGVGFPISQFGAHGAWLRTADVQQVRLRFERN